MGWRHIGHLGVARENRMLVGSIACRCAIGLTRLKSDDYTCRTVRKWLVDAGSIPASSTICGGTDFLCPPFSCPESPVIAGFRVFPCGRDRVLFSDFLALSPNFSLFSLLPCGRVHKQAPVFMRVPAIGLDLASARAWGS